ncbi:MAG: zinc ribbon domain-containing protein [Clostridia bacterium]|nr:zinc ribbon domain-containing protein [Clostridia bacterium]
MKCKKCGNEIMEYDVVCSNCGADVKNTEITVLEEGTEVGKKSAPLSRRAGTLALGIIFLTVISLIAVLIVFISSAGKRSADFSLAPVAVGETLFYNTGESFVRLNTATDEVMASKFVNGKLLSFAISGKNLYYIVDGELYLTDFAFKSEKKLLSDVENAVIYKNEIYYTSLSNPSQLKKCNLNGKNSRLVTLLGADDRSAAKKISASGGIVYILKGERLYCFDIQKEEISLALGGEKEILGISFAKENGVLIYRDGVNKLRLIGKSEKEYDASVSAAAIWDRSVYGAVISDNSVVAGKIDLNKGTVSEQLSLTVNGEARVLGLRADGNAFYLFISVNEGEVTRYGIYKMNSSKKGCETVYSDIS